MDEISSCVESLLENKDEVFGEAVDLLLKIADNVLKDPANEKFRSVKLDNKVIERKLIPAIGALEILFMMGFVEGDDRLVLPADQPLDRLRKYRLQILKIKEKRTATKSSQKKAASTENMPPIQLTPMLIEKEFAFRSRLVDQFERVLIYERSAVQEKARQVLPVTELHDAARNRLLAINDGLAASDKPLDFQDCVLIELLAWFKNSFFKWFDAPTCPLCQKKMKASESLAPTQDDLLWGGQRVEGYTCHQCGTKDRFPRYNNPNKLLETRRGRCGEWANCFTLLCRSMGMDARYIHDHTDHVWTEVYSQSQLRWLHADPCENKMDSPLMYENGWDKKLSYIFAFSKDEIVDVTWRYTNDSEEVRRRRRECREDWLVDTIFELNKQRQVTFPEQKRNFLEYRLVTEIAEFFKAPRDVKESEAEGRASGSLAWRLARGETQTETNSGYVFKISPDEEKSKEFILKYSCAANNYIRMSSQEVKSGWESFITSSKNIFRKLENDWNMVYLSRSEGSSTGELSWTVDWSHSVLKVKSIFVVFQHTTYENGLVSWQLCTGDKCFAGNKEGVLELSKESLEDNPKKLEVSAILEKGKGDCSWQHAQLFRQSDSETDKYPLLIHIKFD